MLQYFFLIYKFYKLNYILNMSSVVIYKIRSSSVSSYQTNYNANKTTQHHIIEGIAHGKREKYQKKINHKATNHEIVSLLF